MSEGIVPLKLIVPEIVELLLVWLEVELDVVLLLVLFCKTVRVPIVDVLETDAFGLVEFFAEDRCSGFVGVGVL